MTTTKLTPRWTTVATRGYTHPVSRDENAAAHGCVCLTQMRRARTGEVLARQVNVNGRHEEVGPSRPATPAELETLA